MTDKPELARRKAFTKLAREIIAAWPDYAKPLPAATNATDRRMQAELTASQAYLAIRWFEARLGKATDAEFEAALTNWWIIRVHAVDVFGIKIKEIK